MSDLGCSTVRLASRTVYAVGDVHGELEMLKELWSRIEGDIVEERSRGGEGSAWVVFLGDYVDLGPESCGVLEFLASLHDSPPKWAKLVFLRGNHEDALCEWLAHGSPALFDVMRAGSFGFAATLRSFGVGDDDANVALRQVREAISPASVRLLRSLVNYFELDGFDFVHADVVGGLPLNKQHAETLLWGFRKADVASRLTAHPRIVVHGHYPNRKAVAVNVGHIGVDTGAGRGGPLTAVKLRDGRLLATLSVASDHSRPPTGGTHT